MEEQIFFRGNHANLINAIRSKLRLLDDAVGLLQVMNQG
jgi:hypothetical protein